MRQVGAKAIARTRKQEKMRYALILSAFLTGLAVIQTVWMVLR